MDTEQLADDLIEAGFFDNYFSNSGYMLYFTKFQTVACFKRTVHPTIDLALEAMGKQLTDQHDIDAEDMVDFNRSFRSYSPKYKMTVLLGVLHLIRQGQMYVLCNPGNDLNHPIFPAFLGNTAKVEAALKAQKLIPEPVLDAYYEQVIKHVNSIARFEINKKWLCLNRYNCAIPIRNITWTRKDNSHHGFDITTVSMRTDQLIAVENMTRVLCRLLLRTLYQWLQQMENARGLFPFKIKLADIKSFIAMVSSMKKSQRKELANEMIIKGLACGTIKLTQDVVGCPIHFNFEGYEPV